MLRYCEACNGCSFYFLASLIKNLLVKTTFASYYLKLSLRLFLKCFLMFVEFQPHVLYGHVSYKKTCDLTQLPSHLDNTAVASFLLPCAESFSLLMNRCIQEVASILKVGAHAIWGTFTCKKSNFVS